MWTTHDIGADPRGKASDWVPPSNPMEAKYNEINNVLKDLALMSGKQTGHQPTTRKSLSNLSIPANNRYAVNKALQARSRQMQQKQEIKLAEPTADVPGNFHLNAILI
jgi:hypothetical protein